MNQTESGTKRDHRQQPRKPRDAMLDSEAVPQPARIVHVAQSIAGGIASYFEEIAEYQSARFGRGNVAFVVPAGAEYLPRLDPDQLICFASASRSPSALLDFAKTARAAIRRLKPDIVHLHSSFAGAVVRPMLIGRARRSRVIYCPHGWAFGIETSPAKQWAYAFIERRLAVATDLIHVNSAAEYDLAARFGLPVAKMRILANGIGWTPRPESAPRRGPLRVAFIGRHDRQKGLDILLDTIRRFPLGHIQFEIIGDGILSDGVRGAGVAASNVAFHGWLSRQETLKLLERVDAVVMPSRWDAAPIVATEAMRAGLPVIGSNRGAISEIIQHGVGGYIFDLDDPNSLGRVLQTLDRDDLKRLGVTARSRWETIYVSDRMNDLTCEAYDELLRRSGPTGKVQRSVDLAVSQAQPCG